MPQLAVLKNISFNFKNSFDDLTPDFFKQHLDEKIEYVNFANTKELLVIINDLFMDTKDIDIVNCHYDKTTLYQGFCHDNNVDTFYDNFVIVKRKINDNDSYTYLDYKEDEPDIYTYYDINYDDIVFVLRKKHIHIGIMLSENGNVYDMEYINTYDKDKNCGKITLENKHEMPYFNIAHYMSLCNNDNENKDNNENNEKKLFDEINESGLTYLYTQKNIDIGLLNCYSQTEGFVKNEIASKLFNEDIYGDVFLGLENNSNHDTRILNLTSELFQKIIKLNTFDYKHRNIHFFNIYYELL